MGWLLNNFLGSGTTPQADNSETGTWEQTNEKTLTLPMTIAIQDIVLSKKAAQNHMYQLYVNGRAQENFIPSGVLNPETEGRMTWADQGMVIPAGSNFQIRAAQKDGNDAEATTLIIKYAEVSG